jgi:hypothetical protein
MAHKNRNRDWHASEHDALDHELDSALRKYTSVEPRAGLENRILANLQAERGRAPHRAWWRWSIAPWALALAAAVIVATLALRSSTQRTPVIADHPSAPTPSAKQPRPQLASNGPEAGMHPPAPIPSRAIRHANSAAVADAHPKLNQFPSPHPLSEQEKILADYVAQYSDQAVLIARARSAALQQDQLEEIRISSGSVADSEEQK